MAIERYILAIDLGTSALKVALVSTRGKVVGLETEPVALSLLPGGGAEQDPHEWWRLVRKAAVRLLEQGMVPRGDIVAVSCTAQWSGTVPVDRNGRPLMNAVIWMDSRGARDIRAVTDGPVRVSGYGVDKLWRWLRKTGGVPGASGKDSLAHILYIRRSCPEVYAATYKFLEPKDYLNLRLTGKFAASFDSIALHWVTDNRDINQVRYDPELLALTGLDLAQLPDLVPSTAVIGQILPDVAAELGLSEAVQVVAGAPDLQSASVGSGATRDFEAHLYVGTSSWLSCHVPFKKTDLLRNMASLPSAIPGRYFIANEQETAGACLTFLRDSIFFPNDGIGPGQAPPNFYALLDERAAAVAPGAGGVIFTPWLYGERTPVEDHTIRGGFHNLSLGATRAHLVRAVLEGVALNGRWLLEAVEAFAGRRLDPIRIIGGGARSELWCQIWADVLDRSIQLVAEPVEANARGAAVIAAVGLGYLKFDQVPEAVAVTQTLSPRGQYRRQYDRIYRAFQMLYRKHKPLCAALNG
ncbi:MAG TPA: FGGY-family carbohydrate kinase [Symbiobacteriaceae bacterium]|nr:FGGY-family carbohydrate kinase [Symbiobacteriaceae bacterium]